MVPVNVLFGFSLSAIPPISGGLGPFFSTLAELARKFFQELFLDPSKHFYGAIALSAVVVLAVVGTAFLVKKIYDRWFI